MTVSVRVTGLHISARIGVNADEMDRFQPLIVSVEAFLGSGDVHDLSQSIDYRLIASIAGELAQRHIGLIETFGLRLAERCLAAANVTAVEVVIEKPEALPSGLAATAIRLSKFPTTNLSPSKRLTDGAVTALDSPGIPGDSHFNSP